MSLYRQRIEPAGLDLAPARVRAKKALDETLASAARGELHALTIVDKPDGQLEAALQLAIAARVHGEENLVVLGTGGSSLGAQAIAQLKGFATPLANLDGRRTFFLDNLDGATQGALLKTLPLAETHFLAVSKSGGTAETLMQLLAAIDAVQGAVPPPELARHFSVITEAKDSPLRRLANEYGFATIEHPSDIGGRFSVLSIVGLLPALFRGLSPEKIRAGAKSVLDEARGGSTAVIDGAAFAVAGAEAGKSISVLMPYSDRLERFALWYRQLWAESLGKNGKGTLPVRALGPVDQHSQLQLYLDGPSNALFTIIKEQQAGPRVPAALASADLDYLGGRTIGDLVMAEARATFETLIKHERPSRMIEIPSMSEEILGALFMHFMLETIVTARMIGVNAFDQPAVEEGKVLAKRYLSALPKN